MVTLKFVTDGTPMGSHVYIAETGDEVKNIKSVNIVVAAGQLPRMILEVIKVQLQASGKAEVVIKDHSIITEELIVEPVECELVNQRDVAFNQRWPR